MKKNYTLSMWLLAAILMFTANVSQAQTTLSAGDIAITGVNGDNPDQFTFVLLVDIEAGTEITFTDSGIQTDGSFRGGEGAVKYTASAAKTAGTVILFNGVSGDFTAADDANVGTNNFNLSGSGDQVIAFQGSSASPTFIYAVQTNSNVFQADATNSNSSALPTGLTVGVNAVAVGIGGGSGDEYDNSSYTGATSGTKDFIKSAIADNSNWTGSNSALTLSTADFTFVAAAPPTKLVVTSINSGNPIFKSQSFSITVETQDASGNVQAAVANTDIQITKNTGTGTLGGTLTGQIAAGKTSVTISGLTYDAAGSGIKLDVARTAGDNLTSVTTDAFDVSSVLTAGDIAIVGFNYDSPQTFAFVALTDISQGTKILFTDRGWLTTNAFRADGFDGTVTWTATEALVKGDVVTIAAAETNNATRGSSTGALTGLFGGGDQILAYQGSDSSPTFLYALNSEGTGWQAESTNSSTSALPSGLTDGTDAIAFNPEVDNGVYDVSKGRTGTKAELLALISNTANWITNDDARQTFPSSFNPTITPAVTAISGFASNAGTASAVQNLDVLAVGLTGDVTVTAPTGYEVSVDGGATFGSPKTITQANIDGKTVTIQIRLAATAAEGAANGDLTFTSTGATDKTVALNGLVAGANTPIITKNGSFTAFTNEEGTASASQSVKVSGSKLTADITATAPTGFEVSLDDATFSSSVTLTQAGGNVTDVTVYVRVAAATAAGSPSGNLELTSTGATQLDVAVSGTVSTPVPVKTIKELREAADANGLPTTTGVVKVKGIVYGGNTQTTHIGLTIIEGTNAAKEGIGLFINSSSFSALGLADNKALVEGDELEIEAEVGHFNGLMQLTNVTKVTKLSTGKTLQAAAAVTTLSEDTESRLIKFENISVKDRSDWEGNASYSGSGFNVTVLVGGAELTVRIDGDTELAKKTYDEVFTDGLTSGITIVGLGGQFDSSDPRDGGYQLAPWKADNITVDVSKATPIAPTLSAAADVTNSGFTASWTAPAKGPAPDSYQLDVATDEAFTSLVVGFANLSVSGTTQAITGLSAGTKYYVRVRAVNANGASNSSNVGIVTTTGSTTGVDPTVDATFKTFPNPNPGSLVIESNTYKFSKVVITTLGSKVMITKNLQGAQQSTIDLSNLGQGVYLVQIFDNNGKALSVRRIVKR